MATDLIEHRTTDQPTTLPSLVDSLTDTVFDVETGPLPDVEELIPPFNPDDVKVGNRGPDKAAEYIEQCRANYVQSAIDKAALSPLTGCVLTIGSLADDDPDQAAWTDQDERETLVVFWNAAIVGKKTGVRLIGHNIHGFDLPFIVRRSWMLGVKVPDWVLDRGRYWHPMFVDTMAVWGCGSRDMVSLDSLARACGVDGKPDGVTGADFARLWFGSEEEKRQAIEYLRGDLRMTWVVAKRLQVI